MALINVLITHTYVPDIFALCEALQCVVRALLMLSNTHPSEKFRPKFPSHKGSDYLRTLFTKSLMHMPSTKTRLLFILPSDLPLSLPFHITSVLIHASAIPLSPWAVSNPSVSSVSTTPMELPSKPVSAPVSTPSSK